MKEITFEELMHNKFDALEEYGGFKLSTKQQKAILELMQQVREATIAECKDKIWNEYGIYRKAHEIEAEFESLPTDRIKLTENK